MYSDKRKKRWPLILVSLVVLAAACLCSRYAASAGSRNLSEESRESVKEAVERAALQCYAVEGAYPPDLAYLTENYGLAVNQRDFYIRYDAFASNLPPDVRVEPKPKN